LTPLFSIEIYRVAMSISFTVYATKVLNKCVTNECPTRNKPFIL